jgi:large subunit GTPase 1
MQVRSHDMRPRAISDGRRMLVGRGFMRSGQGTPDEARAARYILKDYVNGKLLYVHPPPGVDEAVFNQRTHRLALLRAASKKRAPVTRVGKDSDTFIPSHIPLPSPDSQVSLATARGIKSQTIDSEFFGNSQMGAIVRSAKQNGQEFTRARLYPHQNAVADDGTPLSRGNVRLSTIIANAGEQDVSKKHHKKVKRAKQRSGKGYD